MNFLSRENIVARFIVAVSMIAKFQDAAGLS
mgnify:CR=1 FL=1